LGFLVTPPISDIKEILPYTYIVSYCPMRTTLKFLFGIVALAAMTSCSTPPPVVGNWVGDDRSLVFRKDQTFSYVYGTGMISIVHQELNGKYQFILPNELKMTDISFGRGTNRFEIGTFVYKVSVSGDQMTITRPDGSEEKWNRSQKR
jgi:hypothetical protein